MIQKAFIWKENWFYSIFAFFITLTVLRSNWTNPYKQMEVDLNYSICLSKGLKKICISYLQWVHSQIRSGIKSSISPDWMAVFQFLIFRWLKLIQFYSNCFRSTIAKFPALMSCCTINWFHEWPDDALNFVSNRFLGKYRIESVFLSKLIFKQNM